MICLIEHVNWTYAFGFVSVTQTIQEVASKTAVIKIKTFENTYRGNGISN